MNDHELGKVSANTKSIRDDMTQILALLALTLRLTGIVMISVGLGMLFL